MINFDCRRCLTRCEAECCGPCPIPAATWARHQADLQRPAVQAIDDGAGFIHQHGADGRCCFVRPDFTCAIYPAPGEADERAEVCRLMGSEQHPMLTCTWQAADGRLRKRWERRELRRKLTAQADTIIKRLRRRQGRQSAAVDAATLPERP